MLTTPDIVAAILDCKLTKAEWTHEAHLRLGFWHLLRFPPDDSLDRLRTAIRNCNLATGGTNTETNGYHETITRFYVAVISQFVSKADRTRPIEELAEELLNQFGSKALPLQYWSRERLYSVEARMGWSEPDLRPLDFPA